MYPNTFGANLLACEETFNYFFFFSREKSRGLHDILLVFCIGFFFEQVVIYEEKWTRIELRKHSGPRRLLCRFWYKNRKFHSFWSKTPKNLVVKWKTKKFYYWRKLQLFTEISRFGLRLAQARFFWNFVFFPYWNRRKHEISVKSCNFLQS